MELGMMCMQHMHSNKDHHQIYKGYVEMEVTKSSHACFDEFREYLVPPL